MKHNNGMDERQLHIMAKAMAVTGAFLELCIIISMVHKIITTDSMGWEFWALLGSCVVMLVAKNLFGDVEAPKDLRNNPLPTGSSREDRGKRKKNYILESLIFAAACAVMDVLLIGFGRDDVTDMALTELLFPRLSHNVTVVLTAVITLTVSFLISYGCEYLVGEKFKVRRYNDMIAALDENV